MVEHNEDFGSSDPAPASSPENDLGTPSYGEPAEPAPPVSDETFTQHETHEAAFKHPHPAPDVEDEAVHHPVFPMILGAAMAFTLILAWMINLHPPEAPAATPPATATPAGETTAASDPAQKTATPAAEIPSTVATLRSDIEGLKTELKALQDKIEAMPKPAPAPDLAPLSTKIDELVKGNEPLAALPKKLGELDQRVAALDKSLADQRDAIDTLKSEVKKTGEPAPTTSANATKPEDVNVADSALVEGVDLFKAGKYKEASKVFKKLTETNPDDARVWYYAALSQGSATNQWTGETTRLVEKGIEREKAGSPESSKIDTLFASLNPTFKGWLDAYRKAAKAR
jgi:tetratricopeptide (TPR) repeat protein